MAQKWSEKEIDDLRQLWITNANNEEILKRIPNRKYVNISQMAHRLRIKRNKPSYKRIYDLSILCKDTPETYYWLGFLLADGHFDKNTIRLALSSKDLNHIRKFAKYVGSIEHIRRFTNKNGSKQCSVTCSDCEFVPIINNKFKIVSNKTYNPPDLNNVSDQLLLAILIGFIDGDGYIGYAKNHKVPNIKIKCHISWLPIFKLFEKNIEKTFSLKTGHPKINSSGYALWEISNSKIVFELDKFRKNNNLPTMERKWDQIGLPIPRERSVLYKNIIDLLRSGYKPLEIVNKLKCSKTLVYLYKKMQNNIGSVSSVVEQR